MPTVLWRHAHPNSSNIRVRNSNVLSFALHTSQSGVVVQKNRVEGRKMSQLGKLGVLKYMKKQKGCQD